MDIVITLAALWVFFYIAAWALYYFTIGCAKLADLFHHHFKGTSNDH